MPFLTEPEPPHDVMLPVIPGICRIVAANPGPMTYHGTNTYLIEEPDGITVLDPGPDDGAHVEAILAAARGQVARILLSHSHRDHLGALPALRAATGAHSYGFHRSAQAGFTPDVALHDGDVVAGWTVLHTPGHAADHLCFARDGIILSADHVMTWSTTVVSPPHGDMAAYFASLRRLLARDDHFLLPGHGPHLAEPHQFLEELLHHREQREAAILAALAETPRDVPDLVKRLYTPIDPRLRGAAGRNVLAHLLKLEQEGRARPQGDTWRAV